MNGYEAPWVPSGTEFIGEWRSLFIGSIGRTKAMDPPRHLGHDHRYLEGGFIATNQGSRLKLEDLHGSPESALSIITNDP